MIDFIINLDKELLIFLNNLGSPFWDPLWLGITNQLSWTPLFLFIFYLIFKNYGLKRGGFIIFSLIILVAFSDQFTNLIKDSVGRFRPNNDVEIDFLLRTLINPQGKSFMSGHATTSMFFTVFIIQLLKEKYKNTKYLIIFPLIFGYSRLYLGVHFPIDILVGFTIGITFGRLYFLLYKKVSNKLF